MVRRSGLGKGLSALIPTDGAGDKRSALREIPIAHVQPNRFQPRRHFDEEAMASLAASIRELGVLQPILVRQIGEEQYELIAGERRWRAARRAGHQTIPVLVQSTSDVQSLEQALVENLHREDLDPLEEAAAYQQLIDDFGYTHDRVAARVGKSRVTVTNTLRLLQLPPGVQRALAEGTITAGHARALLGSPDRTWQESMVARIVAEGLTVRAVEALVRQQTSDLDGTDPQEGTRALDDAPADASTRGPSATGGDIPEPEPAVADARTRRPAGDIGDVLRRRLPAPGVVELEELLANFLNTRVKVDMGSSRGRVVVEFATLEDLERIYKLMVGADRG